MRAGSLLSHLREEYPWAASGRCRYSRRVVGQHSEWGTVMSEQPQPRGEPKWGEDLSDDRKATLDTLLHAWAQATNHGDRVGPFGGEWGKVSSVHGAHFATPRRSPEVAPERLTGLNYKLRRRVCGWLA